MLVVSAPQIVLVSWFLGFAANAEVDSQAVLLEELGLEISGDLLVGKGQGGVDATEVHLHLALRLLGNLGWRCGRGAILGVIVRDLSLSLKLDSLNKRAAESVKESLLRALVINIVTRSCLRYRLCTWRRS